MEKQIINTLKYFQFFDYLPNFEELYIFLPYKITKEKLKKKLLILERQKKIKSIYSEKKNTYLYTVGEYSIKIKNQLLKFEASEKKLKNWRFRLYIKLLSFFSQIKLVGLSGSISMMNAKDTDDIDLFIITSKNRLFTGRFIALVLAQILGLRRKFRINQKRSEEIGKDRKRSDKSEKIGRDRINQKRSEESDKSDISDILNSSYENRILQNYSDKVCLNLFFDEKNLKIPKFKQTLYVGHEVLQMRPIINKDNVYQSFLAKNNWVFRLFPNAASIILKGNLGGSLTNVRKSLNKSKDFSFLAYENKIGDKIESILKNFQLKLINRHKTTEIITDTQLWFHPDDFEKKIKLED